MKKNILLIFSLALFFSCDKEKDEPVISKTDLLTGGDQKSWYLYSTIPPGTHCSSQEDDTLTFFADGSIDFDHGTITTGQDNDSECVDLVNLEGTWEFKENEAGLIIVARRIKGATEDMEEPATIVDAKIDELTIDRLVLISNTDASQGVEYRPR